MCIMLAGLRGIDEDIWKAARSTESRLEDLSVCRGADDAAGFHYHTGDRRVRHHQLYDLVVAQTSGGPGNASQVPAMYVYDYMFQAQILGQGFAASTMMLLSVLIVLIPWAYLEFGGKKNG